MKQNSRLISKKYCMHHQIQNILNTSTVRELKICQQKLFLTTKGFLITKSYFKETDRA